MTEARKLPAPRALWCDSPLSSASRAVSSSGASPLSAGAALEAAGLRLLATVADPVRDGGNLDRLREPCGQIPARYFTIGLDHRPAGISTDSARAPETTGNNRHDPGNRTREGAASLPSGTARLPGSTIGISAGQT
jgi:hypothetical protein